MKKKFWQAVLLLSLTGCLCCLGFTAWYLYQDYRVEKEYEKLREQLKKQEKVNLEEIKNAEFTGERSGEEAQLPDDIFLDMKNPIDFQKLAKINTDIYAWIRIPDTKIDYPVAQRAGDDTFYLHHDMYQEPRFAGCIYTEEANSKTFDDPNTVIYGHNMKNQSMFQNLHLFADKTFFEEHPYVYIYTRDHVLVYKVFAAYTYDDRHILNSVDFRNKEEFRKYLEEIQDVRAMNKNIREDVEVTEEDKIITLETCVGGQTQSRYLVQAVLIKDESNE